MDKTMRQNTHFFTKPDNNCLSACVTRTYKAAQPVSLSGRPGYVSAWGAAKVAKAPPGSWYLNSCRGLWRTGIYGDALVPWIACFQSFQSIGQFIQPFIVFIRQPNLGTLE